MKNPTDWISNPLAEVNRYPYDSDSKIYDSAVDTYDGVVPDHMSDGSKSPSVWSKQDKVVTEWSFQRKNPTDWSNT